MLRDVEPKAKNSEEDSVLVVATNQSRKIPQPVKSRFHLLPTLLMYQQGCF